MLVRQGLPLVTAFGRRRFLGGAASGLALAAAGPAWAQGSATAARTKLVGALEEDPPVINSAIATNISCLAAAAPIYGGLTYINREGKIEPNLAESWDISPDGMTYTFHLRRNVTWHDGMPFTSADVKYSIENLNSKLHPWGRNAYRVLAAIDTPDPLTVVYRLKQPSSSLMMATDLAVGAILPKHLWDGTEIQKNPLNHKPVGTGPYKFAEYVRGQHLRYVRNEQYYDPGKPAVDELIFRIISDAPTRVAAFESGDLDMLYWNAVPQAEVNRLSKLPNIRVTKSPNRGAAYQMFYNLRAAPLSDVRVRQAFAHAIDRQFIRGNVNGGSTSLPMLGPVPPVSTMYNDKLADYEFSAAKANALLDQAGLPRGADGTRFALDVMWRSTDLGASRIGDVLHRNLADIGIKVNLQPLDGATLQQKAYAAYEFGVIVEAVALGPDPDIGVERFYNSRNIVPVPYSNVAGYNNPEVDKLFDEQRVQTDFARRKQIYDRIQEIIWRDLPAFPLFAYVPNNVNRASYAAGFFDGPNGAWESFADVHLIKAAAAAPAASAVAPAGGAAAGGDAGNRNLVIGAAAAGAAAIGVAGLLWARARRRGADED